MSQLLSKLQVTDSKSWSGLTREAHFGVLGMNDPQWLSKTVRRLYDINYGDDTLVNFIEKLPSITLDEDGEYQWPLQGSDERRIPIVGAATTRANAVAGTFVTDGTVKLGVGKSQFFMVFPERYFEIPTVIAGPHTESYQLRLTNVENIGDNYVYTAELMTGDNTLFVPYTDVARGITFAEMYGQVEQEMSTRGNGVHHTSPFIMRNTTSFIRKNYEVPGNLINKGKNTPMAIAFLDQNGKQQTRWIDKLGFDAATQFRRDKTRLLLYGKSNKMDDGTYGNRGESGNVIRSGFGLYEQMDGGNIAFYNNFSVDFLVQFALGMCVGKVKEEKRKFTLVTGEYGAVQFHEAIKNYAYTNPTLRTDMNLKNGGSTYDFNQFNRVVTVNGIEFSIVIDPMKDDPITNGGLRHPNGGFMSSYTYDIFDFGTTNGEANIKKVIIKGNDEIMYYIPGMRDPFSPNSPMKQTVSHKDGYDVGFAWWGGVAVVNPLATARLLPQGW